MIKKENKNVLNKKNYNYLFKRIKWLRHTAKEMQSYYKKTKNELIHDLYLEILCYSEQIEEELKTIKRGKPRSSWD